MKAASTRGFGKSISITTTETKKPSLGPNDVLVEVYASSVNPKDWKLNTNLSSLIPKVGSLAKLHILGDDLAGIIVDKGKNVTGFKPGDHVYGMDMRLRTNACAEYARIASKRIAHKPANISFNEAAATPLAALTALQAFQIGKLGPSSELLIIGASGGVGTFAVQIAKALGAHTVAVCSHRNIDLVTQLGADEVIDYTREDFKKSDKKFDVIFDATAFESLDSCRTLLKNEGIFITTSGHGAAIFNAYKPRLPFSKQKTTSVWVESHTRDLETIKNLIEAGKVKPIIDSVFPLSETDAAYKKSKGGRAKGKIVIEIKKS